MLYAFIPQSVIRQVHSLFQSDFPKERDLVLPLSSILVPLRLCNSCLFLLPRLPVTLFFHLSFNNLFQKAVPMQHVTNPVSLTYFYCM
jgi:hypothetical protein